MSRERILIVDDNEYNLKLTKVVLELAGYVVDGAIDAGDAVVHIEAARPDLILMDVQLPGLDGLSLTQRLKADPRTAGIRIVALTAFAMKGDRARVLEAGCDDYIPKPIDVRTFAEQIASVLGRTPCRMGSNA